MYLIECAMKDLKGYVHNMAKPKGSMAKGYIVDETLGLYNKYMLGFRATQQCIWDVDEEEGVAGEVLESMCKPHTLTEGLHDIAMCKFAMTTRLCQICKCKCVHFPYQ
jgi:hypothetical protein